MFAFILNMSQYTASLIHLKNTYLRRVGEYSDMVDSGNSIREDELFFVCVQVGHVVALTTETS